MAENIELNKNERDIFIFGAWDSQNSLYKVMCLSIKNLIRLVNRTLFYPFVIHYIFRVWESISKGGQ